MDIKQLKYLIALDQTRHFGQAAALCHITQPTLSMRIRNLEEELNLVLIQRGQRFEGFTAEGERILAWARALLAAHDGRNYSDRFEARFSLVEVTQSPSLLLQGMAGSMMPIAVSHGEGQVEVRDSAHLAQLESKGLVALRFVDNFGKVTESYPANPNGSPNGITAVTSESGRATIMMPHPERVFRTVANSWHPENWGEDSPWMRIFRNARKQLG